MSRIKVITMKNNKTKLSPDNIYISLSPSVYNNIGSQITVIELSTLSDDESDEFSGDGTSLLSYLTTTSELIKSFDYSRDLEYDKDSNDKLISNLLELYNPSNKLQKQDQDNFILLKLLYINSNNKFKKYITDEKLTYISDNHKKYNNHLTNSQFWILSNIRMRNCVELISYLSDIQKILKYRNGICFKYDDTMKKLVPSLCDFILLIDHKINMQTFVTMNNNTYISIVPYQSYDIIKLKPLVIVKDVALSQNKSYVSLNKDELISLFVNGKYQKNITKNGDEITTIDIYLYNISDFLSINFEKC